MNRYFFRSVLICCLFLPAAASASVVEKVVKEGNRFYRRKKYDQALKKYHEALIESPDSAVINFNQGAALYKKGDYEQAAGSFTRALTSDDPRLEARANFNLGNSKYKQGKLKENTDLAAAVNLMRESLDYYKRAIELNEKDIEAKHNHEFVERELKILLDRLKQQQEQQRQEQQEKEEGEDQGQQDSAAPEEQEKEEPAPETREGEEEKAADEETGEAEPEVQPAEAGEEEQPGQMSEEEARMLLEGYGEEETGDRIKARAPEGRYPEALKDW